MHLSEPAIVDQIWKDFAIILFLKLINNFEINISDKYYLKIDF